MDIQPDFCNKYAYTVKTLMLSALFGPIVPIILFAFNSFFYTILVKQISNV